MNNFDRNEYKTLVAQKGKKSPLLKNCTCAFLIGGAICAIGEGMRMLYVSLGVREEGAPTLVSVTLIFITAVLTALGIFDNIAKHAGAGTLVPITGFANSVVSPAIDNKAEGWVLGVGAKIFIISGPVILSGTLSGAIYGIIYWVTTLL